MTAVLSKPSDVSAPVREAGGDNEVPRDKLGRPRIMVPCSVCSHTGKVPSEKTGKPVNCKACSGKAFKTRSYTRTTTYIDVLDDKSNLQAWGERMVLVGVAQDPQLLDDVTGLYQDQVDAERRLKNVGTDAGELVDELKAIEKASKDVLNRKAQVAKKKAGAESKADKGTELHGLSELVDQGLPLPIGAAFGDVIDMDAYARATEGYKIIHMEKLVINDDISVAGTPDRVSEWWGDVPLIAPDGHVFTKGELIITDLKTGTVEYGALKMAMQLAIYSRSHLYDHETGERTLMVSDTGLPVNQEWGIIMNVPAGSGTAKLYWADLTLGWEAVQIAGLVRSLRGRSRAALLPLLVH